MHGSPAINGFGSGVLVGVGVGVGVGVAEGEGVAVGVAEGAGRGTETPLFHTSFLPLLMQVYFFPPAVIACPTFLQAVPAFGAVAPWAIPAMRTKESSIGRAPKVFRTAKL